MNFEEYVRMLNKFIEDNPDTKDLRVIFSADVGSQYKRMSYRPWVGYILWPKDSKQEVVLHSSSFGEGADLSKIEQYKIIMIG